MPPEVSDLDIALEPWKKVYLPLIAPMMCW